MTASLTSTGIAYDRAGPRSGRTIVLVHAGVADRRMWDGQWAQLIERYDVVRLDLRGFGDSSQRPVGAIDRLSDLVDTLSALGIDRCHVVGASYGAGLAVELAVTRPELVASLLLSAPGGSLLTTVTRDLQLFFEAERAALADEDLAAAVEANLVAWVDGHGRVEPVDPAVRAAVAVMQRRAFEIDDDWGELDSVELEPPAIERLGEISAPTTVLVGVLDLQTIQLAAEALVAGIAGARLVVWPEVAHLPSMERPDDFPLLLHEQL